MVGLIKLSNYNMITCIVYANRHYSIKKDVSYAYFARKLTVVNRDKNYLARSWQACRSQTKEFPV